MEKADLAALWQEACRGDPSARERVCLALGAQLLLVLHKWRLGRNDPSFDDVLDESLLRLLRKIDRGEEVDDPLAYAIGVASTLLADFRRETQSRRDRTVPLSDGVEVTIDEERFGRVEIEERSNYLQEHLKPEEFERLKGALAEILAGQSRKEKGRVGLVHALACKLSRLWTKIRRLMDDFDRRGGVLL